MTQAVSESKSRFHLRRFSAGIGDIAVADPGGRLHILLDSFVRTARRIADSENEGTRSAVLAELAVFLHHWSESTGDDEAGQLSRSLTRQAIDLLSRQPSGPQWIGGFTGTAWTLRGLIDDAGDAEGFTDSIDEVLEQCLSVNSWAGQYDLISGLVGYGIYALEHPDPVRRSDLASAVLRHLDASKQRRDSGIVWFTSPDLLPPHQRAQYPDGYHNLGLAHGVAGVIGFLARCVEQGVHSDQAAGLLRPATEWLLAQDNMAMSGEPGSGLGFSFPNVLESPEQSRTLAWCYGDLGITLALYRAGRVLDCPQWCERALRIAGDCAGRRGPSSSIVDAGLCHGAAGAALIFLRFWQVSGQSRFSDACRYWLSRTDEFLRPEFEGSAGVFTAQGIGDQPEYLPSLDRLTGLAGVGLTLLSCLYGQDARWDAPLLTDIHSLPKAWT